MTLCSACTTCCCLPYLTIGLAGFQAFQKRFPISWGQTHPSLNRQIKFALGSLGTKPASVQLHMCCGS